jgi:hypothetical protein
MKIKLMLAACGLALTALAQSPVAHWKLEPGVITRGQAPETWTLDLRQHSPQAAA